MNKIPKYFIALVGASLFLAGCSAGTSAVSSQISANDPAAYAPPLSGGSSTGADTAFKLTCEEARSVHLINLYRKANGRGELSVSKSAVLASRWHAQDMISQNYFSHTEPNGRTFSARASAFGYAALAENIAAGSSSATALFCQWRNSPGHNTNMLGNDYSSTGIGEASGGGMYGIYWSSNFGGRISDALTQPLTSAQNCAMPTTVQSCL